MKYYIKLLILFTIYYIIYHTNLPSKLLDLLYKEKDDPNEKITLVFYTFTPSDYLAWLPKFRGELIDTFVSYEAFPSKRITPWQTELVQCYLDVYKKLYNIQYTFSTLPPLLDAFSKTLQNVVISDDIYNTVGILVDNFYPDIPPSLFLYKYEKVLMNNYYKKNSTRVKTMKDCVDLAVSLNTTFLVDQEIINSMLTTDLSYPDLLKSISLNSFYTKVTDYTYFNPMDIYVHPTRYTLNMGIGIMDNTQKNYTVSVDKNQLPALNHLLPVTSIDTPLIHPLFDLPNYTVAWNDEWIKPLIDRYNYYINQQKSSTVSFQNTIQELLQQQLQQTITIDVTKSSSYFKILPSTYYWVILLLNLFKTTNTDDQNRIILQHMKNATYDPTSCFAYCDNEKVRCRNQAHLYLAGCDIMCDELPEDGNDDEYRQCHTLCLEGQNDSYQECNNNLLVCHGLCFENDDSNYPCFSNSDCQNGACGRMTAGTGEPTVCCPSGQTITYAFNDYCTDMKNGQTCWSDDMCKSDNCTGNYDGLFKGTCN